MKIDQTTGSTPRPRLPAEAARTAARPASAPAGTTAQAAANVLQFPEPADGTFDAAKVAAIREQIRSGQYSLNPERIADGLLDSLRGLLPNRR